MNNRKNRITLLIILNACVAAYFVYPLLTGMLLRPQFDKACPSPPWLKNDVRTGCSHDQMQGIFSTYVHDRTAENVLGSSAYLSARRCPENPAVALYSLMLLAQNDYADLESCAAFFLDRYGDYRSTDVPDPTYHVAGAIGQVGQALLEQKKYESARKLFEQLYRRYGDQLPSYVYQGIAYYYGEALMKTGRSEEGAAVVRQAIAKYDTPEESRLETLLVDLEDGE